jgi:hypothetical protein
VYLLGWASTEGAHANPYTGFACSLWIVAVIIILITKDWRQSAHVSLRSAASSWPRTASSLLSRLQQVDEQQQDHAQRDDANHKQS